MRQLFIEVALMSPDLFGTCHSAGLPTSPLGNSIEFEFCLPATPQIFAFQFPLVCHIPLAFASLCKLPFTPLLWYCAHLFFMCLAPETTHIQRVGGQVRRFGGWH